MNRKIAIKAMALRINLMLPYIYCKELTESALVIPFLMLFGVDADILKSDGVMGTRSRNRDEQANYAIFHCNHLNMICACIHHQHDLEKCTVVLNRHWKTGTSKYGMITNGIEYRIYSPAMIRQNDFSRAIFGFSITSTHADKIDRILNACQITLPLK